MIREVLHIKSKDGPSLRSGKSQLVKIGETPVIRFVSGEAIHASVWEDLGPEGIHIFIQIEADGHEAA